MILDDGCGYEGALGLWFFVGVDSGFSSAVRVRRQGAWIPASAE